MDGLPVEMCTNILPRLPIKSVLRFRLVCKTWCSVIDDDRFPSNHHSFNSRMHNNLDHPTSFILFPQDPEDCKGELYFVEIPENNDTAFPSVKSSNIRIPFSTDEYDLMLLGSSNGFLCFSSTGSPKRYDNPFDYYSLHLYNPFIHESIRLPDLGLSIETEITNIQSGFGWVSYTNEFKVVQIVSFYDHDGFKTELHIFSLVSKKWRMIGNAPDDYTSGYQFFNLCDGSSQASLVLVNCSLHLINTIENDVDNNDSGFRICIVSIDLECETFGVIPTPQKFNRLSAVDPEAFQVGAFQGCLCISDSSGDHFGIWIMKEYNVCESWIKQFVIRTDLIDETQIYQPLRLHKTGGLLLLCGHTITLVSYKLEESMPTSLEEVTLLKSDLNYKPFCYAIPYSGHLISPKSFFNLESSSEESI